MSSPRTRWELESGPGGSDAYVARFRRMASEGADLAGEARLVDALAPPGAHLLDAGCGPGRVGAVLHGRGHTVVGVDADATLIAAACADHPGPRWIVADLVGLDLGSHGISEPFDGAVLAGNVMVFVAPGTEQAVLEGVGRHVRRDGFVVAGFDVTRHLAIEAFDRHAGAAGLVVEHRFATWDLRPWRVAATFAVTVLRTV